jgi:hypothetical protein
LQAAKARRRRTRTDGRGAATTFSSGDLVEDLTHNFFLETGARNNKLKVYEMVDHPAAGALTGYLLVRGGVQQTAYARALENLTGANLSKLFPTPRIPTEKIPECKPHIERGDHLRLYRFSPQDYQELAAVFNGPSPETGEELVVIEEAPEGVPPRDLPPQPAVFAPDYAPEEISEIATKLRRRAGLPKEPTGLVADLKAATKALDEEGGLTHGLEEPLAVVGHAEIRASLERAQIFSSVS